MHFTSGVTYRVLINPDGTLGQPEILKKWTSETYAPKKKAKPLPKKTINSKSKVGSVEF